MDQDLLYIPLFQTKQTAISPIQSSCTSQSSISQFFTLPEFLALHALMRPHSEEGSLRRIDVVLVKDTGVARWLAPCEHRLGVVVEREVVNILCPFVALKAWDLAWVLDPVGVFAVAGWIVAVVSEFETVLYTGSDVVCWICPGCGPRVNI